MKNFIIKKSNKKDEKIIPLENSRFLFLTGAGISTGSGLQTYYGKDGAYTNMDSNPEDIINQYNMDNHPEKIWDAISGLIIGASKVDPTISHKVIADIGKYAKDSFVFTQNVDDLHCRAGSENVIQVHGRGKFAVCRACGNKNLDAVSLAKTRKEGECPTCPDCGDTNVRPSIVPFYGMPYKKGIEDVYDYCQKGVDYLFVIGTQLTFEYIQNVLYYAKRFNPDVELININPEVTPSTEGWDFFYRTESDTFFKNTEIK